MTKLTKSEQVGTIQDGKQYRNKYRKHKCDAVAELF